MKILLDMDGVLVDFNKGAHELHNVPDSYDNHDNHGVYEIQDLIGIQGPEFWDPMGEEFWANLKPTPHMEKIVSLLVKSFGGKNICLLTSPVRTPGCIKGKMRWIEQYLPAFRRQFLVGPAKEFCAHSNSLLVDDREYNVAKFREAGGNAFLVPAPWNLGHCNDPIEALENYLMREHARH